MSNPPTPCLEPSEALRAEFFRARYIRAKRRTVLLVSIGWLASTMIMVPLSFYGLLAARHAGGPALFWISLAAVVVLWVDALAGIARVADRRAARALQDWENARFRSEFRGRTSGAARF